MANIYDSMVSLLREHWKAHSNAYPQRFELSANSFKALNEGRELVITNMNYKLRPGWESDFQGVPVVVAEGGNCMVDKDGVRVPLDA